MAVIILLLCFLTIFLFLGRELPASGKKEIVVISVLTFSAILTAITEFLSLIHELNYYADFLCWSVVTIGLVIYLYSNSAITILFCFKILISLKYKYRSLTTTDKVLLTASAIILLLIACQAVIYPPNNWDSMTYHMARITSWVSHESLAHYPTDITRQLYQPPLAEYFIMNIGLLSHSDIFSNLVQFFFLPFSFISIIAIMDCFGISKSYKIIAIVLAVTIPEVVLQASSTQNDIVVSFFILTTFLYTVKFIQNGALKNFIFIGFATGLAILTKGTAYVYLPPILLLFGIIVLIRLFKTRNYHHLSYSLIAVILAVGLNCGYYVRNYKLTHNILGVDKTEAALYSNQKMSGPLLVSSLIKNAGNHLAFMYAAPVAKISLNAIDNLHQIMGININGPANNYRNLPYNTGGSITGEDGAPNLIHFILITITLVLLTINFFREKRNLLATALSLIFILQLVFFCVYLKWQPWHTRLHIPLFLMSVVLICYCFSIYPIFKKVFYWLSPIILIYALLVVLHNDRRPYDNKMAQTRYHKYFTANPTVYAEYQAISQTTQSSNYKNIGLILGEDSWEYPLFSRCFIDTTHPVYISVNNFSKKAPAEAIKIQCIISTTTNTPYIDFKGKRFINKTIKNKSIYLYE